MSELTQRLRQRAKEDQTCADNSKVIVEALAEQMRLFERREGHNVYAVRMAVDHKNSVKRDSLYAADLLKAADDIERLTRELSEGRRKAFEEAAHIAYRTCAENRHVKLGDACAAAIRQRAEAPPK